MDEFSKLKQAYKRVDQSKPVIFQVHHLVHGNFSCHSYEETESQLDTNQVEFINCYNY